MTVPAITVATTNRRTCLEQIQAAMGEIGMPRPTSIEGGDDETGIQLLYMYNAIGENLTLFPFFEELNALWTITTTTASAYDLPFDWGVPIKGTNWDRTGRWPLLGPKTATEWQYLKSGFGVAAPQYRFRFLNGRFELFPAPVANLTIVQEYISKAWVVGLDELDPTIASTPKLRCTADTDYCMLDERMMIEGLKLAFKQEKGLDYSFQEEKWQRMFEAAWAGSKGAPSLSLAPTPANIFITEWNAPDTGYGQ